jgi:N-formylglutamate deformylase
MPAVPPDLLGPRGEFGHREHLRLAWRELREHGREVALTRIETAIRDVAEAHGAPQKYHRTITEAWAAFVAYHLAEEPALDFDEFLARFPGLLDGALLTRHFSTELLATPAADRRGSNPTCAPSRRTCSRHL